MGHKVENQAVQSHCAQPRGTGNESNDVKRGGAGGLNWGSTARRICG
jgi:hypothetical protein